MKISHCKLKKNIQKKLLEYLVLEVTARSAANLLQINPDFAALFYKKVRQVIDYYLSLQADEVFSGLTELDESWLSNVKEKEEEVLQVKQLFSES